MTKSTYDLSVRMEVGRKLTTKCTVFWDIKPCSPLKVNKCFGGKHHLHLQDRISRARY
jgi:hypothetical protein